MTTIIFTAAGPLFFHARAHCPGTLQVLSWLVSEITSSMHQDEGRLGAAGLSLPQAILPVGTEKSQGLQAPMGKWEALRKMPFLPPLTHILSNVSGASVHLQGRISATRNRTPFTKAHVQLLKGLAVPAGLENIV